MVVLFLVVTPLFQGFTAAPPPAPVRLKSRSKHIAAVKFLEPWGNCIWADVYIKFQSSQKPAPSFHCCPFHLVILLKSYLPSPLP